MMTRVSKPELDDLEIEQRAAQADLGVRDGGAARLLEDGVEQPREVVGAEVPPGVRCRRHRSVRPTRTPTSPRNGSPTAASRFEPQPSVTPVSPGTGWPAA